MSSRQKIKRVSLNMYMYCKTQLRGQFFYQMSAHKLSIETKQTGCNYTLNLSKNISVINFSRQKSTSKLGLAIMSLAFHNIRAVGAGGPGYGPHDFERLVNTISTDGEGANYVHYITTCLPDCQTFLQP
jgi:hypothetical protein